MNIVELSEISHYQVRVKELEMIFFRINLLHCLVRDIEWYLHLLSDAASFVFAILFNIKTNKFELLRINHSYIDRLSIIDAFLIIFEMLHSYDLFELNDITVLKLMTIANDSHHDFSIFGDRNIFNHLFQGLFTIFVNNCKVLAKVIEDTAK